MSKGVRAAVPRDDIRCAVVSALSTAPRPRSRAEIDVATGFTAIQTATILRDLVAAGVVEVEGDGRERRYSIVLGADLAAVGRRRVRRRVRKGF